jgi:membrane-bound lytic murein transglycosylase MltF
MEKIETDAAAKWLDERKIIWIVGCTTLHKSQLESLLAAYAAEVEAGKWVDVSERLPSEDGEYIVQTRRGEIASRYLYVEHDAEFIRRYYVAWMPKPAPYVPAQQEEQV